MLLSKVNTKGHQPAMHFKTGFWARCITLKQKDLCSPTTHLLNSYNEYLQMLNNTAHSKHLVNNTSKILSKTRKSTHDDSSQTQKKRIHVNPYIGIYTLQ